MILVDEAGRYKRQATVGNSTTLPATTSPVQVTTQEKSTRRRQPARGTTHPDATTDRSRDRDTPQNAPGTTTPFTTPYPQNVVEVSVFLLLR